MAEFTEVCRQAIRKATMESGGTIPAYAFMYISAIGHSVVCHNGAEATPPEKLEADIMQWAAEHPEPRYPTWKEWQDATFPQGDRFICMAHFMDKGESCFKYMNCSVCRNKPIPADIAEKLGIKPIGGKDE